MYIDSLMLPESFSKHILRLISRQIWCISSDSVVYPMRRGKDGIPANLYKSTDLLTFFTKNAQINLANIVFFVHQKTVDVKLFA